MLLQAQDDATLRSLEHVFRDTGGGILMHERKMLTRLGGYHLCQKRFYLVCRGRCSHWQEVEAKLA
jgi:hypothetical protein